VRNAPDAARALRAVYQLAVGTDDPAEVVSAVMVFGRRRGRRFVMATRKKVEHILSRQLKLPL